MSSSPLRQRIGTSAALITPFDENGAVLWQEFATHAKRLLGRGVSVVTAFGTTGEGVSIDRDTRAPLFDRLSGSGISPAAVAECVYGPSSLEAGRHAARSLAAGCAAVLLAPPFYFKGVSDEGLYRWHAEVFEAAGGGCRDVILYNIPSLTGVTIGAGLTGRLRRAFPEIIAGVKDSGGDWPHTMSLLEEHRDLAILVGHEGHLAKAVQRGASGAISGIANIAPALVARLVTGREDQVIDDVLSLLLRLPVVPAIKAVAAMQWNEDLWSRVRAPLTTIDRSEDVAVCASIAALVAQNVT